MLRRLVLAPYASILKRNCSINAPPSWDLVTAICVERLPVVVPPLTKTQSAYSKLQQQLEFELSMKSDHERRHENDLALQARLSKDSKNLDDVDSGNILTAQDFEDTVTEELAKFPFAIAETAADKKKDLQSLERGLQHHLVLLTEVQLGDKKHWLMPQGVRQEGESLRQTAERVLASSCGSELQVQFLGNAPCGFYKYKYPKTVQNGKIGSKVFFYYARHIAGNVQRKPSTFKWLKRDEIENTLPQLYHSSVAQFLVDETTD